MRFASLGCVMIALETVPAGEMRMVGRGARILRCKMLFRFPMVRCGLFVMVRGVVMMSGRGM